LGPPPHRLGASESFLFLLFSPPLRVVVEMAY
jgi:hypothetical protein